MYNKKEAIGRLNRRVWIQRRGTEENSHSEKVEVWTNYKQVWAGVEYPSTKSDEVVTDTSLQVAYTFVYWTIKYDPCVGVLDRIVEDGKIWNIKTVAYPDYKRYAILGCEFVQ